jgi:uncharacterized protein YkwD
MSTRTWTRRLAMILPVLAATALPILGAPSASAAENPCKTGYVPREAYAGDMVCVTPKTHAQAQADNAAAASRIQPGNNGYGPKACKNGFVWREARPSDLVCVTPANRTLTKSDNSQAAARRATTGGTGSGIGTTSQVLSMVNQARAKAGCKPFTQVAKLTTPAAQQSRDQAARDRMGHDGANGSTITNRLGGLGYSRWAENVAQYPTAQAAFNGWMNSAGHKANILNCAYTQTGLGVATSKSGKPYWTQTFAG